MRMIIPDLLPGTEYAIQVRADNGSTQSQWSNIYIVETSADVTPPSVPEWDLTDGFASIGDTFVATWQTLDMTEDHNLDFSHYEIELSDGTKSVVVRTTNTSYTLTFEQNGIFFGTPKPTILARVRSVDMVGNVSAWNDQKSATNPPPAAPANISVTSLYDSIKVSWAAVVEDDMRGYMIQVSRTSNVSNFTPVYEGPDTEYIHGTDQWLDDHWYRVYAVDKFGSVSSPTTSGAVRPKSSFEIDMTPPAVPTGLTAAIHNNPNGVGARAELHWSQVTPPSNDLGGFNIRWRELGGTEWTISNFPKDERSGAIQLPSAYKDYEFQIRSHDWTANYSAWSATVVGISPENAIPKAPTNFGVTVSNSTFVVTWDEVVQNIDDTSAEDISYYEVGAKPAVGEEVFFRTPDISFELSQDVNSYVFGTPQPTVTFRVRAVDTVGQGTWTSNISKSIPLPSSPTGLTGTTGANSVYLSWTPPAGTAPTKYYVYQGTSSGPTTLVGEVTGTSYLTIVNDTTPQYFSVRSVDNYGQMSAPVSAGPFVAEDPFYIDTTPPPVPTALAATIAANANGVGSRASVSWAMASPPEDLVGFYLSYKKGTDTHWSSATFDKAARNATVELQDAYAAHNFRILAVDRNGNESAWSPTVNATAPAPSAPPKTTGVASVAGRYDIRYTWTPSSAADLKNYEVTFSTSSTFATGNTTFHTGTAASLTVGGLSPSTTYYVRVRAVGSTGLNGPWSDTHTKATLAQITPGDIGAPTTGDLDAVDNRVDDVEVKVDESIKSYVAEYAVNSSETVAPATGWSTATPTRTPGSFIWTRTKVTYHDDTSSTTNPALLTGNTGAQGSPGIPGPPGTDGTDGASLFTWLKYADTPTTGMSDSPTGKTYMGISYNNTSATESSDYNDYYWSLIKGADGSDGDDGIGISGTVVEYTKSTNGVTAPTTGWDGNIPATVAGEYLWTRTVTTYTDDSTSVAHSVARHGATGSPGANGRGITGTVIDYQKSNNGVDAPTTGTWTTAIPATSPGEYLWTRTTTSYTSAPTSVVSYSVARHGVTGQQGIQGPPGEDGEPTYTWIKYADDDAGSNMSDEPDGKTYIGIAYNKTTEVESTVPTEYKWSLIQGPEGPAGADGEDGAEGPQGPEGEQGVSVTSITPYYARITVGSTLPPQPTTQATPPAPWQETEPDYLFNTELYRVDQITYSNTTYAYTARVKVSAYTAAVTAISAANGKNNIFFGGSAPTPSTPGRPGDVFWVRSGNTITEQWLNTDGTGTTSGNTWLKQTLSENTIGLLNAGKISTGTIDTAALTLASSGVIQSADYSATLGWKLDSTGLVINKGQVKASTLIGDTIGSSTGTINIAAGANIQLNGGYIKSNTNAGTTMATAEASGAGFYLGNDGLFIGTGGKVKANALISDTLTSTTITLGTGGEIKAAGWTINSSGITIPNGAINVAAVNIGAADANGIINKATTISGDKINTGSIKSNNYNATTHTGWSINTSGAAEFSDLNVWGDTTVGAGAANYIRGGGWENSSSTDGWGLRGDGKAYLQDAVIRGSITATGGTIGGFTINATTLVGSTSAGIIQGGTFRTTSSTTSGVHITQGGGIYGGGTSSPNFRVDLSGNTTIGGDTTISGTTNMSGTLTLQNAANLTFAGTGKITGGSGANTWTLGADGLSIPDGAINVSKITTQMSPNIIPMMYASFETRNLVATASATGVGTNQITNAYDGEYCLGAIWLAAGSDPTVWLGSSNTDYNISFESGGTYIVSGYFRAGGSNVSVRAKIKWSNGVTSSAIFTTSLTGGSTSWVRASGAVTVPAGVSKGLLLFDSPVRTPNGFSADGIQIEKRTNPLSNEPSPWKMPGATYVDGGSIKTGSIQSTALAKRPDGTDISDVPAWSINTAGSAVLGDAQVRGRLIVGQSGEGATRSIIKSYNYEEGDEGWAILSDGTAEFNDVTVRGSIVGSTITGTVIDGGTINGTEFWSDKDTSATRCVGTKFGEFGVYRWNSAPSARTRTGGVSSTPGGIFIEGGTSSYLAAAINLHEHSGTYGIFDYGIAKITASKVELVAVESALQDASLKGRALTGNGYDTGWEPLTLASGWSGTAQYRIIGNVVYLRGSATRGGGASGTTVMTMPVQTRPAWEHTTSTRQTGTSDVLNTAVRTNGIVAIGGTSTGTEVHFSSINPWPLD